MPTRSIFTIFATVFFIFACAQKRMETHVHAGSGVAHLDSSLSPVERKQMIKNWVVSCKSSGESSADCPEAVAQMISTDRRGTDTLCTATLIAPDLMLTNSHCFEDAENKDLENSLCQSTKFVFAATGDKPAEAGYCKEIVMKSDVIEKKFNRADYMIIRLKAASSRQPITITRKGISQHEDLIVHKIDPDTRNGNSVMRTAHCTALQGTAFLPSATHDSDPILVTRDCNIIDGNSGSPLTNTSGQIAAIVFASVGHGKKAVKASLASGNSIALAAQKALMARITNFACLPLPSPIAAPGENCPQTTSEDPWIDVDDGGFLDPKLYWPSIVAAVKSDVAASSLKPDKRLGFHASVSADKSKISYAAFCFKSQAEWLDSYLQQPQPIPMATMNWDLSWSVDSDLKATPHLTLRGEPETHLITFDAKALSSQGLTSVTDQQTSAVSMWAACPSK